MRRRVRVVLTLALFAVMALLGWGAYRHFTEPRYDGKTVSQWVQLLKSGEIGRPGAEAVPALISAFKGQGADVRNRAAEALGGIGPSAVPALTAALKEEDAWVRRNAATALGRIGPAAKEAIPALLEARQDPSPDVQTAVAEALPRIGPKEPN